MSAFSPLQEDSAPASSRTNADAPRSMNLRVMGFCGIDDSISPELLHILSIHYTWIEWGVLLRTDKEGTPRYASTDFINRLCRLNRDTGGLMKIAGHLCGNRCQQVIDGDYSYVKHLAGLGFGRVQVNATNANDVTVDPNRISDYVSNLRACMSACTEVEWIIQCNDETRPIWEQLIVIADDIQPLSNMSVLFDASCGLGKLVTTFPSPYPSIPCGYAGGIGPDTIESVLSGIMPIAIASKSSVWIDMESSLRVLVSDPKNTSVVTDTFSIDRVFQCILIGITKLGLKVGKFTLLSI